jgi:hypothetical protein
MPHALHEPKPQNPQRVTSLQPAQKCSWQSWQWPTEPAGQRSQNVSPHISHGNSE